MTTPGVNLIPARRLKARRSATRMKVWMGVVPASAGLFVAAYIINRVAWDTDANPVHVELLETEAKIKESQTRIATQAKELRESEARLRANRAVGEQPDWGMLLSLLAAKLGDDAALSLCSLEPVEPPAAAAGAKGPANPGADRAKETGRPQQLKLILKGNARTQEAASTFVLALERTRAFDRVNLVETQREPKGEIGIAFEVVCEMSDAGEGGAK